MKERNEVRVAPGEPETRIERLRRTGAETKVGKGLSSATRTPPQEPDKKAVSTESEGEAREAVGSQQKEAGGCQHRGLI